MNTYTHEYSSTCSQEITPSEIEGAWLDGFGRNEVLWSEYTLYRIVLDHYKVTYITLHYIYGIP
jgi:hypothetical protein